MLHGGGTDVRVPPRTRRPARRRRRSRAPTRARARSSRCGRCGPRSRSSTTRCAAQVQIDLLLEGRAARGARVALAARQPAAAARHRLDRRATSARARWRSTRRSPGCWHPRTPSRSRAAPTSCASAGVPEDLATRVAALPTMFAALDIVEVADETGLDVEQRGAPCTSASAAASGCTGCATASWRCRATTAGARARARRCATTSTRIHRALTSEVLRSPARTPTRTRSVDALDRREPGVRADAPDARRHPQRAELRPDDAARGGARDAQPDRRLDAAVSSSLTSQSRRAVSSSRAARFG